LREGQTLVQDLPSRLDKHSKPGISRAEIDIWEHAALLYHAYERQAAADIFYNLSQRVVDFGKRTLCLLNVALIQARLGDFQDAAATLEGAVTIATDQTLLIVSYIVGLVSCAIGDFAKAGACFEICLADFGDEEVDLADMGIAFALEYRMVHENFRAVKEAEFRRQVTGSSLVPLNGIPAEMIFEAPQRPLEAVRNDGEQHVSLNQSPQTAFLRSGTQKSARSRAHEKDTFITILPSPERSPRDLRTPTFAVVSPPKPSAASKPARTQSQRSTAEKKRFNWRRRPSEPHRSRDTPAALNVAQHNRPAGKSSRGQMVPRDPRGEYAPVGELAHFIETYAPEYGRETSFSVTPVEFDSRLSGRVESKKLLENGHDVLASPQESPLSGPRTAISKAASPEVLQPTVYRRPTLKPTQRIDDNASPRRDPQPKWRKPGTYTQPTGIKRAMTDAQAEDVRRDKEREHTLRLLEGRVRAQSAKTTYRPPLWLNKPLPLPPEEASQNSAEDCQSVATVNFFEKVIADGQRSE
jgi:tetratricopeptide (TPR) repeat protein